MEHRECPVSTSEGPLTAGKPPLFLRAVYSAFKYTVEETREFAAD
jgi:hypothetical protein